MLTTSLPPSFVAEYQAIAAGLQRLEDRINQAEEPAERAALRTELVEWRGRLDRLREQISAVEAPIDR